MNKSDLELQSEIDRIARDIRDRKDDVMAMEFTRTIAELLKENGIVVNCRDYSFIKSLSDKNITKEHGVVFDSLDCTEHDKPFKDEIRQLKHDLEEVQTNQQRLPRDPIKVAEMLIDATEHRTNCMTGKEYGKPVYEKWQLRQIAEHLLVYCNHNSEDEKD